MIRLLIFFSYSNNYSDDSLSNILLIKVSPGNPIIIFEVNLHIYGDGEKDDDYLKIIKNSKVFVGKKLSHDDYEQLKNELYNLAIFKGYLDAKFRNSQLVVIPSLYQCIWNINFYTGRRYFFGKVQFKGNQIRTNYLDNMSNIRSGEYYSTESIIELNKRLSSTNWFKSISISSNSASLQKEKIILNVLLYPNVKNSLEIGTGYSVDTGLRGTITWRKPWINVYGHSLENNFNLSKLEQVIDVSYKIPSFNNPLEQYYLLQGGIVREQTHGMTSNVFTVNIARCWNNFNSWQRSMNLHWYYSSFLQNSIINSNSILLYPGINISRVRQRGDTMPYWGDSQRYSINISNVIWKSKINFVIFQAHNAWIRTWLDKHRVLICGHLNWTETNKVFPFDSLLRFFYRDHYCIRGYKSVSFCEDTDDPIAINKLFISSVEYQYNIFNKWWGVIFLDVGKVGRRINQEDFKLGCGIGVRWTLPVGPMKLDIAVPLINNKTKISYRSLCFYISVGPEL